MQPIDGQYLASWFFWITAIVCAAIAVIWNHYDGKKGRTTYNDYKLSDGYKFRGEDLPDYRILNYRLNKHETGDKKLARRNRPTAGKNQEAIR
jgi:hypothetical protein